MSLAAPLEAIASQHGYLNGTFAELCRIESPSGSERACAERVIAELRALDVHVEEDGAGALAGCDCGNLLARVPAGPREDGGPRMSAGGSLLLCAHLDTVPPQALIEPVLRDGVWENANEGILGADNKAAVAVLLALARHVHLSGAPLDLELLFTVGEERSLAGALVFDVSRLRSAFGYVFDHASPIGEIVAASPSHFRFEARFRGSAAHAGIRPQDGRSAILAAARAIASLPHGALDGRGSVNVGTVEGGSALNVVAERCSFAGEVRSLDEREGEALVAEVVQCCYDAANLPDCDCDCDVSVERSFAGYRQPRAARAIAVAESALRDCGHEASRISSGGGSDANALLAAGFQCVNLANGTERAHEAGERVSQSSLEEMLAVALSLVEQAGLQLSAHR